MQDSAARLQGSGATEARSRMNQAKAAAGCGVGPDLAPAAYTAALAAERTAQRAFDSGDLVDATARFYEASGLFRSAEVSAQSEAALRASGQRRPRREGTGRAGASRERARREGARGQGASRPRARAGRRPPPAVPLARPEPAAAEPKPPAPPARPESPHRRAPAAAQAGLIRL
jgi:hypothetical protein